MKKHFGLLAIVFVSLLTACSKKSDDVTPDGQSPDGQSAAKAGFYCKVDGKDFAPDFAYATSVITGTYGIYGLYSSTSDIIHIQVPLNVGKGTHKIDDATIKAYMTLGKNI